MNFVKTLKILALICLNLCVASISIAQKTITSDSTHFTTKWGDPAKIAKFESEVGYIGTFSEQIYLYKPTRNGKPFIHIHDEEDMSFLDKKEVLISGRQDMHEILFFQNKIYGIYSEYDGKKSRREYYIQELGERELQFVGKEKRLASIKFEDRKDEAEIQFCISPDRQKIGFSIYPKAQKVRKYLNFKAFVLDESLRKIWTKQSKVPVSSDMIQLNNMVVNSQGDMFALLTTDGAFAIKEDVALDFTVVAFTHEGDSIQQYPYKMQGEKRYLTGAIAAVGFRGRDFAVTGLYRADDESMIEGAFSISYSFEKSLIAEASEPKFIDIQTPMPSGITQGRGSNDGAAAEEGSEDSGGSDDYFGDSEAKTDSGSDSGGNDDNDEKDKDDKDALIELFPRTANHNVLTRGMDRDEYRKHYVTIELLSEMGDCYDLFVFSLLKDGTVEWVRPIPKAQEADDADYNAHVTVLAPINDMLYIVFNDMAENLQALDNKSIKAFRDNDMRSIVSMITLDYTGNYEREEIINASKLLVPASGQAPEGKIVLYLIEAGGANFIGGTVNLEDFK